MKRVNRVAWVLAVVLALVVLVGAGMLVYRYQMWRCYFIARNWGYGASLAGAPLQGTDLTRDDLREADLEGANLRRARLTGSLLMQANLKGADLRDADLIGADLTGADLTGSNLTGVHYNAHTRWPPGFDPLKHGAILEK